MTATIFEPLKDSLHNAIAVCLERGLKDQRIKGVESVGKLLEAIGIQTLCYTLFTARERLV